MTPFALSCRSPVAKRYSCRGQSAPTPDVEHDGQQNSGAAIIPSLMSSAPALALSNISVTFVAGDAGGKSYTAVRDTTLTVGAGEFVSVVGPTGCGKSTLLNIAAGLLASSAGERARAGSTAGGHQPATPATCSSRTRCCRG